MLMETIDRAKEYGINIRNYNCYICFYSTRGGNRYNYSILQFCYWLSEIFFVRFLLSFCWVRLVWVFNSLFIYDFTSAYLHWLSWAVHLPFILSKKGKLGMWMRIRNDVVSTNQGSDVGLWSCRCSSQSCLRKVLSHLSSQFYAHSNDTQKRLKLN